MCLDLDSAEIAALAGVDEPECAGAFGDVRIMPDATLEVTADTVAYSGSFTMEMDIALDDACVRALAGSSMARADATFCAELQRIYNEPDPTSSIDSASCSAGAGVCRCTAFSSPMDLSDSASYSIEGNTILNADGTVDEYCVQGDTLSVRSTQMAMGVSGRMVLRRR